MTFKIHSLPEELPIPQPFTANCCESESLKGLKELKRKTREGRKGEKDNPSAYPRRTYVHNRKTLPEGPGRVKGR